MSVLNGIKEHYRTLGPSGIWAICRYRLLGTPSEIMVKTQGVKHPIVLRMRTNDLMGWRDIFQNHEYLMNLPTAPQTIVDAGANIGLTSIYFANKWPNARIIAIEPEPENFRQLVRNTKGYPNVVAVLGAVWNENTRLSLFDPGKGAMMFQTVASADGKTEAMTLTEVMRRFGMERIDLLKIDVEGAEKEVFEHSDEWIDRVGNIIVEIHDDLKPGCAAAVARVHPHFQHRYNNGGAGTHYMQREVTPVPGMPEVFKGSLVPVGGT